MFGHYYDKSTTDNELLDKDHFLHLSNERYMPVLSSIPNPYNVNVCKLVICDVSNECNQYFMSGKCLYLLRFILIVLGTF